MDITSDAAKIRLATFQLEGESQVWWDWVKTSVRPEKIPIFKRKGKTVISVKT